MENTTEAVGPEHGEKTLTTFCISYVLMTKRYIYKANG